MPTTSEIISALVGAWKIARRDPTALAGFEFTADAFWRSFAAFIFAIPFYLVFITASWRMADEVGVVISDSLPAYAVTEFFSYIAFWVLYPVTMIFVCRALDLTGRFAPYITVYNWSSILVAVLMAPPYVLYSFGLAGPNAASFLIFLVFITALLYRWQIALTVLAVRPPVAAGIVAVEFVLAFIINIVASAVRGAGG